MDPDTLIIFASVVLIEIVVAAGIWRLVRWARGGAIRREVHAVLTDSRNQDALRSLMPNMGAILDEIIEVDGVKVSRVQYIIALAGQTMAEQMTAWLRTPEGAKFAVGLAQNAGAGVVVSAKAWLHGAGVSDAQVAGAIQAASRYGGGEGGGIGNIITEDGELDLAAAAQAVMGLIGGNKDGGKTVKAAAGSGRIGN